MLLIKKVSEFVPREALPRLRQSPLQQLWRDHLLACSLLLDSASDFHRGTFALVYPARNSAVEKAAQAYRACLASEVTFRVWTLESVLHAIAACGAGSWAKQLGERYLGG